MTVKTGTAWAGTFVTQDATGALATPSTGPAGVLYVDGTANAAEVTITGTNPYKFAVTLPALTAGQRVDMYITATIATIATAGVVASEQADTALVSEVKTETAAILEDTGTTLDDLVDGLETMLTDIHDTDLPAVKADTAAILTDTGTTLDTLIKDIPTNTELATALGTADDATLAAIAGLDTKIDTIDNFLDTEVAAILADTNELQTDLTNGGRLDLLIDSILEDTAAIGTSVLAATVEGTYTVQQVLRIMVGALAGKVTGGGTTTITFRDLSDTLNLIAATVDSSGNRSGVTITLA